MLPTTIKVALPFFLLAVFVGNARAFDFEPEGGWGQLWLNQTEPEGEIDQLGDLTVRRCQNQESPLTIAFFHQNIWNPEKISPSHDHWSLIILLRYGPATNSKWVLWGHDIFGPLSGANIVLRIRFRFLEFLNVSRRSFVTSALLTSNISGRTMEYCSKMNQDLGVSADSNKQWWEWW